VGAREASCKEHRARTGRTTHAWPRQACREKDVHLPREKGPSTGRPGWKTAGTSYCQQQQLTSSNPAVQITAKRVSRRKPQQICQGTGIKATYTRGEIASANMHSKLGFSGCTSMCCAHTRPVPLRCIRMERQPQSAASIRALLDKAW
jgi:hypothetical protein